MKIVNEFAVGLHRNEVVIIVDDGTVDLSVLKRCTYEIAKNNKGDLFVLVKRDSGTTELAIGSISEENAKAMLGGYLYIGSYTGVFFEGEMIQGS